MTPLLRGAEHGGHDGGNRPTNPMQARTTDQRDAGGSKSHRQRGNVDVLRSRGFRRYLAGFGASLLADGVWFVALGWAAGQLADAIQTSLVMAAGSFPRAVLLIFGGAIADRRGLLRTVLVTQRLRLLVMAGFTAAAATIGPHVVLLAVTATVFGLLDALHMPAAAALPPALLSRRNLPAGQGLVQSLERLAMVAAAPLGGVMIAYSGVSGVTALATVLLLVALPFLSSLRRNTNKEPAFVEDVEPPGRYLLRDMGDGLRVAWAHEVIGPVLLVVTMVNLALTAPLNVGLPILAARHGWAAAGFGLVLASFGAGAAVGALSVLAWRPQHPALAGLVWVAVGALAVTALGSIPSVAMAAAVAAFLGFTSGPASALLLGLVQAMAPADHMARIMSLVAFSAVGLVPIGYLAFGLAVDWIGVEHTYRASGLLELAVVAVALTRRNVRRATL